jgi:hypothetical protein
MSVAEFEGSEAALVEFIKARETPSQISPDLCSAQILTPFFGSSATHCLEESRIILGHLDVERHNLAQSIRQAEFQVPATPRRNRPSLATPEPFPPKWFAVRLLVQRWPSAGIAAPLLGNSGPPKVQ